jgi:hypothetical protein
MKDLINNIITFLQTGITNGDINIGSDHGQQIATTDVYKGVSSLPATLPRRPYIAIDDGGERVEDTGGDDSDMRVYSIIFEMASFVLKRETALDDVLDLSNQVKGVIELEANRLKDGHTWGISIQPFEAQDQSGNFFKGRKVVVEYNEVTLRPFESY